MVHDIAKAETQKIEMQFHSSRNRGLKRKLKHNGTMQARAYEIRYKPAELSKSKIILDKLSNVAKSFE